MFNKKSKTNNTVNSTPNKSPSVNMISEGTHLKGELNSENDIRIAGNLEGEIHCKSKLIVTSSARIEGDIYSENADISGNIDGAVKISDKLILRQSAKIDGDVYTKTLVVEEGAQINGDCRVGKGAVDKSNAENSGTDPEKVELKAAE